MCRCCHKAFSTTVYFSLYALRCDPLSFMFAVNCFIVVRLCAQLLQVVTLPPTDTPPADDKKAPAFPWRHLFVVIVLIFIYTAISSRSTALSNITPALNLVFIGVTIAYAMYSLKNDD